MHGSSTRTAMRWSAVLVASGVVSGAGVVRADDDSRPRDRTIPIPPGDFTPPPLPDDARSDAPVEGWWKKKGACPEGTRLDHKTVTDRGATWEVYACKGTGSPRPYSASSSRGEREAWWDDADGKRHGGLVRAGAGTEETELYVHGKRVGRHVRRVVAHPLEESFEHYRDDKHHGLTRDAAGGLTRAGYYVDGTREGVWFVWNTTADMTRAKLVYKAGQLDGVQRWWTRDGTLVARGTFAAGQGTWTAFGPDKARTETRCQGRTLVESTARDRAGTIVMRFCGTATSCKAIGPSGGGERQTLGEMACEDPTAPPFKLW